MKTIIGKTNNITQPCTDPNNLNILLIPTNVYVSTVRENTSITDKWEIFNTIFDKTLRFEEFVKIRQIWNHGTTMMCQANWNVEKFVEYITSKMKK